MVVTGGLGCAPVVAVINYILMRRERFGRLTIVQGVKHAAGPDLAGALCLLARIARCAGADRRRPRRPAVAAPCRPRDGGVRSHRPHAANRGDAVRARADDGRAPRACWLRAASRSRASGSAWSATCNARSSTADTASSVPISYATTDRCSAIRKSSRCSAGGASEMSARPRVAVHKFSSCDGCQLAFLNLGEALLQVAELVDFVHFAEAGPVDPDAAVDIAFVEGSISTPRGYGAHRARARQHALSGHHRRVRDCRRNTGVAQPARCEAVGRRRLRAARSM